MDTIFTDADRGLTISIVGLSTHEFDMACIQFACDNGYTLTEDASVIAAAFDKISNPPCNLSYEEDDILYWESYSACEYLSEVSEFPISWELQTEGLVLDDWR